jgi:four helix bundle protein
VPTVERFEELEAWQSARELTRAVYELSNTTRLGRDFGLRDQMCRACVSTMANIAEGFESRTRALFIDFLGRAKASAGEVRSHLYVALDTGYLSQESFDSLVAIATRCSRQIAKFIIYLKSDAANPNVREKPNHYGEPFT